MTTDPRTTAELLDDADHGPADHGTSDRLDAIRAVADKDGVRVEVDVHGAMVDLRISEQAMHQAPHLLADHIANLVAEASRTAAAEGLALLYWTGGAELASHLMTYHADERVGADRTVSTADTTASEPAESDTIEPTTWAVPLR